MKRILLILAVCIAYSASAQIEYTMQSLRNVYQSSNYNPAYVPDYKLSIGLPVISSVYGYAGNTGFSFSDLVTEDLVNGSHRIDFDQLAGNFSRKKGFLFAGAQVDLFHIHFKQKNNYWSFHSKLRTDTRFSYPKDLFKLIADGNTGFDNNEIDLSGLAIDHTAYIENAIGFTKQLEKWTVGGRVKLLLGANNVRTSKADLKWKVNADDIYQYEFTGDYEIRTAGLPKIDTSGEETDIDESDFLKPQGLGFGVDLGASYQITPRLLVSGALNDLGFIKWSKNTYRYKSSSGYNYDGVVTTIQGLDNEEPIDEFDYELEIEEKAYSTSLRTNVNLSARYKILHKLYADAVLNAYVYRRVRVGGSVGAYWEFKRFLNITLGNTMTYGRMINPSMGVVVKPGPFQFYVVTDNLATVFGPAMVAEGSDNGLVSPYRSKAFGVHFGMNLVFGRVKTQSSLQSLVK